MFKKKFISIYFLTDRIYLLLLNSKKNKIKKYASVELPDGLIKDYKVQDEKALASIIKETWKKIGFKEKSAGIVIPEFSTFAKLLSVPNLPYSELNEAVLWQAREYLPENIDNMVIDWMNVGKNKKGNQVLAVAIKKDILSGYVKAVELAGLFPLAVETPSLSLARVTGENTLSSRIIIYQNQNETLLILVQGKKILGTSVLNTTSESQITKTALKFLDHYKVTDLDKVIVGGNAVSQSLVNEITSQFKDKVEAIELKISGFDNQKIQEYLIPICMQLNDLSEPADPSTLNLLPAELVEKYKKARLGLQVWSLVLTATLFIWASFLIALGSFLFLSQQTSNLKTQNTQKSQVSLKRQEALANVKDINDTTNKVLNIKKEYLMPQEVLNEIEKAKPQGITITKNDLDFDKKQFVVSGTAANRLLLVEFKQNLEENENITSVEVPISSLAEEENLEFRLSFSYAVSPKKDR